MSLSKLLFATIFLLSFQQTSAQRNYDSYNFLGIQAGILLFDIHTNDLVTEQREGFSAGFTTRGAFRNNFDLIYGISFLNAAVGIEGNDLLNTDTQYIGYTIHGVTFKLIGSYNIIVNHLSLELGPIFGLNGKMKLNNNRFENYVLTGYNTLTASEIQDISKFNALIAAGITGGFKHFRLSAQYHYGLTNILSALNKRNLENNSFKGNSSTVILSGVIYF
ncbi:PorT family protein [Aequorivita sp. F47161]|uniref:PorT family protein n=1 Tax=Aequorivita vitellina TaxID=2874475 RepID=A0A9X1QU57_9FLAO|nr:outer membrane beta-barrel protein [Aequorivita vitellina]MCG2417502.1 PorT family protein [Aequorivita vitellina]